MEGKIEKYKNEFISYVISCGISRGLATEECEAHIENVGEDELDFDHPEWDANECLSYWSE